MLASLATGGDDGENHRPQDPGDLDHLSESSSSDDESQVSRSRSEGTPSGLFGEAPEEDEGEDEQGAVDEGEDEQGAVDAGHTNQPGARPTTTRGENRYKKKYRLAWEEIARLEGKEVASGDRLDTIRWQVVESVTADEIGPDGYCGAKDPDFYRKVLGKAFFDMWPGDFDAQFRHMCDELRDVVNPQRKKELKRTLRIPTKAELYKFIACLIAAAQYSERGVNLFAGNTNRRKGKLRAAPDFSAVMSHGRFCQLKAMVPLMMEGANDGTDDWWKARGFVDGQNKCRRDKLFISRIHVMDECMSGFWPR